MANIIALITIAFAGGILASGARPVALEVLYTAAGILFLITLTCIALRLKLALVAVVALFFVIGQVHLLHSLALSPNDISNWAGTRVRVYGLVRDVPQILKLDEQKIRVRYKLSVTAVEHDRGKEPASGGMLLSVAQSADDPVAHYGATAAVQGEVLLPHAYNNPGLVDSVAALRRQEITARMTVKSNDIAVKDQGVRNWRDLIDERRNSIISLLEKVMPPGNSSIMAGMLLGGYQGIKAETLDDFAATGIIHILSVSGTHVALAAGVVLWIGGRLGIRMGGTAMLASLSICFYSVLAGLSPPVIRSALMGLTGLAAIVLGREKDTPVALFLSALFILIYQPQQIYDISFQLTFGATAGIVFLYAPSLKLLSFMPRWLAGIVAVTLSAQLGVLPFVAWYFNTFSLVSLPANIIIVPIIEFVVILGLAAALASPVAGTVAAIILIFCSLLIDATVKMADWLADLPGGSVYLPSIGMWGGAVYYILLAWVYGYKPRQVPSLSVTLRKWPKAICALSAAVLLVAGFAWLYPRPVYVHFIDVGQGDAMLVTTPHRRAVLIDTGGTFSDSMGFDVGRQVVLPYLKHYGVTELDYLVLTHGHQDHAGGSAAVATAMPVKTIMLPRENYAQPVQALLYHAKKSTVVPMYDNQQINLDGIQMEIVYAPGETGARRPGNEMSSVIRISYGRHSFLVTGDLEARGESDIAAAGRHIASTVLKVGHHGAKTSSTSEFIELVHPQYAVISVGYNNMYGHPHQEVLNRLAARGASIYRTDRDGAVVFATDGDNLTANTFVGR